MLARRIWNAFPSRSQARCRLTLVRVAAYKRPNRWERFNANKQKHWENFFSNPSKFWDARQSKEQSKFADFEHKDDKMIALYIDKADQNLQQKLALLDSSVDANGKVLHRKSGLYQILLRNVIFDKTGA